MFADEVEGTIRHSAFPVISRMVLDLVFDSTSDRSMIGLQSVVYLMTVLGIHIGPYVFKLNDDGVHSAKLEEYVFGTVDVHEPLEFSGKAKVAIADLREILAYREDVDPITYVQLVATAVYLLKEVHIDISQLKDELLKIHPEIKNVGNFAFFVKQLEIFKI